MEYDVWARSVIWQAERWLRHHMAAHNVPTPRTLHEVQELRAILHSIAAAELHRDLHEDEDRLLNELLDHRLANIATALGRLQPEIPSFLLDEGRN